MSAYTALRAMGITLPEVTAPVAAFVPFARSGNQLFLSGHIAKRDGAPWIGQLGSTLSTEEGQVAARQIGIDLIGTLQGAVGDLDQITRVLKLTVLVNSSPTYTEQHLVANGASRLFQEVFGDRGAHVRTSFGVPQLPFGACVEIELIAEVS